MKVVLPFISHARNSKITDKPHAVFLQYAMAWKPPPLKNALTTCFTSPNLVVLRQSVWASQKRGGDSSLLRRVICPKRIGIGLGLGLGLASNFGICTTPFRTKWPFGQVRCAGPCALGSVCAWPFKNQPLSRGLPCRIWSTLKNV